MRERVTVLALYTRRMREGYGTWFVINPRRMREGYVLGLSFINPRRMREGYGTWFVVHSLTLGACARVTVLGLSLTLGACARVTVLGLSFVHSFIRSVHRVAETITHF